MATLDNGTTTCPRCMTPVPNAELRTNTSGVCFDCVAATYNLETTDPVMPTELTPPNHLAVSPLVFQQIMEGHQRAVLVKSGHLASTGSVIRICLRGADFPGTPPYLECLVTHILPIPVFVKPDSNLDDDCAKEAHTVLSIKRGVHW